MKALRALAVGFTLIAASSCNDPVAPNYPHVTLTASQASNLVAKAQTMSTVDPDLAWLADSIEVVLKTGTLAANIPITVDGTVKRYYAVSIIRQIIGDSTATSTWHVIAFDDATTPTDFILVNAWAEIPGDVPIGDFAIALGAPSAFAHKVKFTGAAVTDYVGQTGTVDFSVIYGNTGCGTGPDFTCRNAYIDTSINITQARPDATPSDVHTFSMSDVAVPGVWLLWTAAP
jgi:hypothetical protein